MRAVEYSPLESRINDVAQTSHDRHITKPDESFLQKMTFGTCKGSCYHVSASNYLHEVDTDVLHRPRFATAPTSVITDSSTQTTTPVSKRKPALNFTRQGGSTVKRAKHRLNRTGRPFKKPKHKCQLYFESRASMYASLLMG